MAELEKLLAFMSSWDRQAAVAKYEALFDASDDPALLIEELGTPTRVAVELAKGYASSPPPETAEKESAPDPAEADALPAEPETLPPEPETLPPEPETPLPEPETPLPEPETPLPEPETPLPEPETPLPEPETLPPEPETLLPEPETLPPEPETPLPEPETPLPESAPPVAAEAPRKGGRGGLKFLFWLFAILIGLPVAVLLICLGLPFLAAGAGVIAQVIVTVPGALSGFNLISDILLLAGAGLALLAVGLLLAWLGLWLSISLCRLWIGGVLLSPGRRLYAGKK